MLKGMRYRLSPTPEQAMMLQEWAGVCRSVWNTGLAQRREYTRRGGRINYVHQAREMAEAKREFPWLAVPPSDVLQQTLMDLDKACKTHGTRAVRWRSRSRWRPSMRLPQRPGSLLLQRLGRRTGQIRLPKLGWVKLRYSREAGVIRSVTVGFEGGHWWVSVLVEDGATTPEQHQAPGTAVGVDRGVKVAVADSAGGLYDREFVTGGEQRRMIALQRRMSRQARRRGAGAATSNRAKETRAQFAKLWTRVRWRRADFCQQLAHQLCRDHSLIGIEELRIKNMTASASGTIEEPGKRVAQKAGLNRAILSKGWGTFELALRNQARTTGTQIIKISPAYTSQRCSACGHVAPESRESQAVFRCVVCKHHAHADVNAARNILTAALAAAGRDGQPPPEINGRISHDGSPPFAMQRQPPARS